MHEVRLVGSGHDDEARKAAEIGHVERTGMGRPVGADEPRTVHGETHRQALDCDVMHDLVVGALQECRVNGGEGLEAFGRQPRGESHPVLFGDTDVEATIGEFFGEKIKPGSRRHRGGDSDDLIVLPRFLDEGFCIDLGVGGCGGFRLCLRARRHVELDDAVILVGRFFGGLVALALFRDDMDEERSVLGVAHVLEHRQEMIDVVAVDRPDVEESEFVEQRAAGDEAAGVFLDRHRALLEERRQQLGDLFDGLVHRSVSPPRDQAREIARQRADRRCDRHIVVVENDDEARVHGAGVVHGLIGHAGRHGAVADHRDDVVGFAAKVAGDCHAEPGRNRSGGVGRPEGVVFALGALGETGQPAALA